MDLMGFQVKHWLWGPFNVTAIHTEIIDALSSRQQLDDEWSTRLVNLARDPFASRDSSVTLSLGSLNREIDGAVRQGMGGEEWDRVVGLRRSYPSLLSFGR